MWYDIFSHYILSHHIICDVMWCDVMWCDVMWCDVMWCELRVIRLSATRRKAMVLRKHPVSSEFNYPSLQHSQEVSMYYCTSRTCSRLHQLKTGSEKYWHCQGIRKCVLRTSLWGPQRYVRTCAWHSAVEHSIVQYSTVQYSTVHYSTLHYSAVHYSTVQYTTVHYSTLQYTTL